MNPPACTADEATGYVALLHITTVSRVPFRFYWDIGFYPTKLRCDDSATHEGATSTYLCVRDTVAKARKAVWNMADDDIKLVPVVGTTHP